MSVSIIITKLAGILKRLADRDAKRAVLRQQRFKSAAEQRAKLIHSERVRLERKLVELSADLGAAKAQATLGDNKFNEQERVARTLSRQLGNIAG